MATGTQSLPTDSPILYFQLIERGYVSEGSHEGVYTTSYVDPSEHTVNIGDTDYHSEITETDRVSTFTGLDDYDTLFAARHGRGALDPVPRVSEQLITTTPSGISPPITGPELINPMERVMSAHDIVPSGRREQASHPNETAPSQVVSPSSEIIEGAAILTDMMETILNVLDKQVAMSPDSQQPVRGLSSDDNQTKRKQSKELRSSTQKRIILIYSYLLWKITG